MAIDGVTGRTRPPTAGNIAQKAETGSANKSSAKSVEKTDSVAITATAQEIKKALESSSSASLIDVERVAAVKKAIADGSYQVNAEKIAEKMIQHEKLMFEHDNLEK